MIITVTMNPAIDKTVDLDVLQQGGLNRIRHVEYDAGGKGINVSKTIRELGGSSIATGFLAGGSGRTIERVLKESGIETDFVWADGETRTNTKVIEKNGKLTELNEPGPFIPKEKRDELLQKLVRYAGEDTLFVLSGSVPAGVGKDIYGDIIRLVHKKGSAVLLDADGEVFRDALEAGPDIIKPNRMELEEYAMSEHCGKMLHDLSDEGMLQDAGVKASEAELWEIAAGLQADGIRTVVVSMGADGALFLLGNYHVKCPALSVKAHSTVGAGDAMVAALACAWDEKLGEQETVKLCMAASAGAVTTIGTKPPAKELVEELAQKVIIEKL